MKLLYCLECQDVLKIIEGETRWCRCGCSYGEISTEGIYYYNASSLLLSISSPVLLSCAKSTLRRADLATSDGYSSIVRIVPIDSDEGKRMGQ